jgi:ubiquinone/menaquinone biosynthesis C-methylase UbiE
MLIRPFAVRPHNIHNEGAYPDDQLVWRRIGSLDKARNLQQLLGQRQVYSVLEVGCGTGAVLAEVARRGIGVRHVGVDMADPHAHLDAGASGLQIEAYDGQVLPYAGKAFDLVYASHVVEHVPDPRSFLRELKRVARKYIYLEVPCELHARATRDSLQRTLDIGHINAYSPESFILLVQTSDLTVVDSEIFDHSLEVHAFKTSRTKAYLKKAVRSALLQASRSWASRSFTYHCGVLCTPDPTLPN